MRENKTKLLITFLHYHTGGATTSLLNFLQELDYEKEQVQEALRRLNISEQIRGEALTLAQFAALSNELEGK